MLTYIIRRMLLMIPTLIGITAVVFFVMALSPGGVGGPLMREGELKAEVARAMRDYYNKRYGLDKPLVVQYGRWLNQISPLGFAVEDDGTLGQLGFKKPNLGVSWARNRPVLDLVREAAPITIMLNLITLPITYSIAILSGIYAARHRGKTLDLVSGVGFLGLWSLPTMWVGVMLIGFVASRQHVYWFPGGGLHDILADKMAFLPHFTEAGFERGWLLDFAWHLVLPVFCLTYGSFAVLSKLVRGSMLENLAADYVRTARAKGVDDRTVLFRHVFRNSLLPLITVLAGILPGLLAGSVIVESLFSIQGMGKLAIDAVNMRDRELVLAETLIGGMIGLVSILIADIGYAIADPRVSYE